MEIFKNIHSALPSKLLMVGDGPERPLAEDLTRQYGLDGDVRFLGKQEQMEEILAVSDVFLLPSEYESFGLAALEAMAASTVVISSDAGGLGEINIDGAVTNLDSATGFSFTAQKAVTTAQAEIVKAKIHAKEIESLLSNQPVQQNLTGAVSNTTTTAGKNAATVVYVVRWSGREAGITKFQQLAMTSPRA